MFSSARRKAGLAAVLVLAAVVVSVFVANGGLMPTPRLDEIVRSGRYSVVAVTYAEVRLGTPNLGGLINNLNTIVVDDPRILIGGPATMPAGPLPAGGYVLVGDGPKLGRYAEGAIDSYETWVKILKERGITPRSEGIPYHFGYLIRIPVKIYELNPDGTLTYLRRVDATHMLIRR